MKSKTSRFSLRVISLSLASFILGAIVSYWTSEFFSLEMFSDTQKISEHEYAYQNMDPVNEKVEDTMTASITFAGDAMFDRHIRMIAQKNGYDSLLNDSLGIFSQSDMTIINLEGPITTNVSRSLGSAIGSRDNYYFTFSPEILPFLKKNTMSLLHLGNNHIFNFGEEGLQETQKFLKDSDLGYFGSLSPSLEGSIYRKQMQGVSFSFISYNQFSSVSSAHIAEYIQKEQQQSDFVVVYTHWGEEYKTISNQKQRDIAHTFIDSGADVIIGSHPHVIQEKEIYKGKTIYYSLGNFIFDQYFSEQTKKGLIVRVLFDKKNNTISFEEFSVSLNVSGVSTIGDT